MKSGGTALAVASGAVGVIAALTFSAPTALADPVPLIPEPAPAPAAPAIPTLGPSPGPAPDGTVQSAAATLPTPPDGMPHLSSPENLPPGTTDTPDPQQGSGSYIRDLWHAYQTQEISGRDALLLLSQRPMASASPPAGVPANPAPPLAPGAAPAPASEPEPAPAPPPLFPWLAPPPEPAPTP
ncbi:hypothetical protein Mycsm_03409 [Mycobacterium sp. JS623]|uniref:hypothetical protein n=1 Tax=Mycobacterium sp. JS623 TaxID=212767 RepID=UPI0002A58887|nr:hypothetical protein [Mycobacterium sp. JS623]AGB23709.1 hypothetical protein Mycsm_03409 [Mycobacterium sp. JS623]